ncbi:probable thioredoxin [Deinococcus grandis]|uniref:Probable thioredoxin n=1 Tax=Deinococcus grandis TaxID=57498 RepID=A0A117DS77_9DEIO|nr:hypothetical protein [Deinococcus grandis]GAQ23895.1 probable thioredoxin [Deinococcus grandis]
MRFALDRLLPVTGTQPYERKAPRGQDPHVQRVGPALTEPRFSTGFAFIPTIDIPTIDMPGEASGQRELPASTPP